MSEIFPQQCCRLRRTRAPASSAREHSCARKQCVHGRRESAAEGGEGGRLADARCHIRPSSFVHHGAVIGELVNGVLLHCESAC
jgi:hypothetical protein